MGNARISTYVIGMVMFTFLIYSGVTLISDFQNEPQYDIDNSKVTAFSDAGEHYSQLNTTLTGLSDTVLQAPPDPGILGVLNAIIQTAWGAFTGIPSLFGFMNTAYIDLANFFGVPSWIPGILVLIVTIIILFVIVSAIFQTPV